MIKEIILFCYGDSRIASTWSNVPFMMSNELERQGVILRRVNISCDPVLNKICNKFIRLWDKCIRHSDNRDYTFIRTSLFRLITRRKIAKAVKKWPDADFCLFMCFDFYNDLSSIPSMVFSDWTYEILKQRKGEKPDKYDRKFIASQNRVLSNANLVLPLFSTTFERLSEIDGVKAIYPGFNVVNNMALKEWTKQEILERKTASDNILFIGGSHYAAGLKHLIKATEHIEKPFTLHVIGMNASDVPDIPTDNVVFHGYLRKDVPHENEQYYNLLAQARVLVNPTPLWGAYSSVVEAMYYYTPIIISPYEQFVHEFGPDIDFGSYIKEADTELLAQQISDILTMSADRYRDICINAHNRVKDYTWQNYVKFILDNMQAIKEK